MADFEISTAPIANRRTVEKFDIGHHIKPKHLLRWEYMREVVPVSVLNDLKVYVLKAALDGAYNLTPTETSDLRDFANYCATIPHFLLKRFGDTRFTGFVRDERRRLNGTPPWTQSTLPCSSAAEQAAE